VQLIVANLGKPNLTESVGGDLKLVNAELVLRFVQSRLRERIDENQIIDHMFN
jgi:hypothetical protein